MYAIGKFRSALLLILIASLAGCSTPVPVEETPSPEPTASPTPEPIATDPAVEPDPDGPITLRVWVPPEFHPEGESPAGAIFQSRLDDFAMRRPNVNIEVRAKNVNGFGGILDSLSTASAAAPLALPDLVALDRHSLESAASVGLIYPYDGLTSVLENPDWYEYARQLSFWQNATFGIPFAGDALVMAYRPAVVPEPPVDWASSLALTTTLTFPAADPNAFYTFSQYQSLNAPVMDENQQPFLDVVQLTQVLSYYQQASTTELMPFWLTQFENDTQSWEAYEDSEADLAITWASRYLQTSSPESSAVLPPTYEGRAFTLADGWVWAMTTNNPDRQLLTAQFAEFLTTSEYLASWTAAAGLFPPRPSATAAWDSQAAQDLVNLVAPSAQLIPSLDLVVVLGPVLQQAAVSVLKAEADPTSAAEAALEKLNNPP